MPKVKKIAQNSTTGRFASKTEVASNPSGTFSQQVKIRRRTKALLCAICGDVAVNAEMDILGCEHFTVEDLTQAVTKAAEAQREGENQARVM